jgi:uncharacterized protein (DUF1015 family)
VPEIRPFGAVRYRLPDADLARVLAPPYDVITPDYLRTLAQRHPRNVVRLILNLSGEEAGYAEAGRTYRAWLDEGVLAADPQPALYLLEQTFTLDEGRTCVRRGLLARFRAEEPARGTILPHEQTRTAAREDRYRMLKETRANFSPIFLMFPDAGGRFAAAAAGVTASRPLADGVDDAGMIHRLWRIGDAARLAELTGLLGSVTAYIADGHHRHATALRYRDERGPEGAWTLGYFTPLDDPGLVVLPYHRIVTAGPTLAAAREQLAGHFAVRPLHGLDEIARATAASQAAYAFGLASPAGDGLVVEAREEASRLLPQDVPASLCVLDSFFLHTAVLGPLLGVAPAAIEYVHSRAEARAALASGRAALAVLMRSTPVRQVVDVADARESMPAKSTFFHPKLPSGLVIHPLAS